MIAKHYDVNITTIQRIKSGVAWSHVQLPSTKLPTQEPKVALKLRPVVQSFKPFGF